MQRSTSQDPATSGSALDAFQAPVRDWFARSFAAPTPAQARTWPHIAAGRSTLLLAPTGSGKTLAAFLSAIDRLMFSEAPPPDRRCRVLYISPLKALGVDVERNLRAPLVGIRATAERDGAAHRELRVGVRSGDTPPRERTALVKEPPDILITTPESLYLMLTSGARESLRWVETVIVDEIHAVAGTKRGTHLFLSLERLETLRAGDRPLQRVGLSATQRPLEEIRRLLGGGEVDGETDGSRWRPREVEVVDAGRSRALELRVEVPVEDMRKLGEVQELPSGNAAAVDQRSSIWPAIHPELVALIREHRSTMIFVNNRRLTERLAAALNELAGEELVMAHHGSMSKSRRKEIEDRLKRGELPAIAATSSLELGIDMGAVDLVIQVEAPPSVASGLQRVGRSGHQIDATSRGVFYPKYRGDLLACAAVVKAMAAGRVEATHYPRNPLDVLAQQIVAAVALEDWNADDLFALVRRAAPYATLPRASFDGVLDMLSGRFPSDEFSGLRPRVTWERRTDTLTARRGAHRIALTSGGTIPDRGLYGVFLADGDGKGSRRVGELDEEMVFESRQGDVFILGASSWRVEEISHDRVVVSPAPGEPGRLPFWRGEGIGRPAELGRAIGALAREIAERDAGASQRALEREHGLTAQAARNLITYVRDQKDSGSDVPTDRDVVIERFPDEIGDPRIAIMTPLGSRVAAPWAAAIGARFRRETGTEVDLHWTDDGIVVRLPEHAADAPTEWFLPPPDEVEELILENVAHMQVFAARFREAASRALLLPRRAPGRRMPLWIQRRRGAELLQVATRFGDFPIVLEAYRECLQDVFDLDALRGLLADVEARRVRVIETETRKPSPFASSLLFNYTAAFLYEGDMPAPERRAHALTLDQAQLRELMGDVELRRLLDPEAIARVERELQRIGDEPFVKHPDHVHDLLLALGDLTRAAIAERAPDDAPVEGWIGELLAGGRVIEVPIAGEARVIAAEDAARVRDGLGVAIPKGLPYAFTEPVAEPLRDLVSRYARTHGPFTPERVASRFGLGEAAIARILGALAADGRLVEGAFLPGGSGVEYCDHDVLRRIKRLSLARLRKAVEPVSQARYARFLAEWQGIGVRRRGSEGLYDVVEQLQGVPIPASDLESRILPARIEGYRPGDIDALIAAGEVTWVGRGALGPRNGRIALYLTEDLPLLADVPEALEDARYAAIRDVLAARGAVFFPDLVAAIGGGFEPEKLELLWDLVWAGEVTNDTLAPVRALVGAVDRPRRRERAFGRPLPRRRMPRGSEGRWSLAVPAGTTSRIAAASRADEARALEASHAPASTDPGPTPTERAAAYAAQLLDRYGVLTREAVGAEGTRGGFSAVYPVLKALEEVGKIQRGYFVEGLGASQFASGGAASRLRKARADDERTETLVLAATDPANAYGAAVPWPQTDAGSPRREGGARVVLWRGHLLGWLSPTSQSLLTFTPEDETDDAAADALAGALVNLAGGRPGIVLATIDGEDARQAPLAARLRARGFTTSARGLVGRLLAPADPAPAPGG